MCSLDWKSLGKVPLGGLRKWVDNIRMNCDDRSGWSCVMVISNSELRYRGFMPSHNILIVLYI
jgi:hypothetical protein